MAVSANNLLGCGRDIDDVWANAESPPTAHESRCASCQEARERLSRLQEVTRELKNRDIDDPLLHLPTQVLDKVASVARAEVRRGNRIPLQYSSLTEPDDLTVSEQAVATVVRHASDQVEGVQTGRCSVRALEAPDGEPSTPVRVAVRLDVTVSADSDILRDVSELRARISRAVEAVIGVRATTIDVYVEDLHDD
ncbi:MAG: hypothetical protein WA892_09535 [Ornithinimicrobium sp.]